MIDGFESLSAKTLRTETKNIFVAFQISNDHEEVLIAEIMTVANEIVLEEKAYLRSLFIEISEFPYHYRRRGMIRLLGFFIINRFL